MAQGPDPNRNFDTDREHTAEDIRAGGGIGNPSSTRMGLSSGVIAVIAVLVGIGLLLLMR